MIIVLIVGGGSEGLSQPEYCDMTCTCACVAHFPHNGTRKHIIDINRINRIPINPTGYSEHSKCLRMQFPRDSIA
jgi:hypothetical protein